MFLHAPVRWLVKKPSQSKRGTPLARKRSRLTTLALEGLEDRTVLSPSVINVTSPTPNGTYGPNATIQVAVHFNEPGLVTGTPTLALNSQGTAFYSGGSGSSTLSFVYVVGPGQTSLDLDYVSNASLSLNGGSIRDAANNSAFLALPFPSMPGSLGFNSNIVIASSTATGVTNVSALTADGIYGAGSLILITVQFSQAVSVTGTPTLALNSGGTAFYLSGDGTNTLLFRYFVGGGHSSSDLDYTSTIALALNTGTIKDATGRDAILTLAPPSTGGSLGFNKNIVISAPATTAVTNVTAETDNGMYEAGATIVITVEYNSSVLVIGSPSLELNSGGTASYSGGSGTHQLTFTYVVDFGQNSAHLDYTWTGALNLNGGFIQDGLGTATNNTLAAPGAAGSLSFNKHLVINTAALRVVDVSSSDEGTHSAGSTILITVTFSDMVFVTWTPLLLLNSGGTAYYTEGNFSNTLIFTYVVGPEDFTEDLYYGFSTALLLNGGTIRDFANNDASLILAPPGTPGSLGFNKDIVITQP